MLTETSHREVQSSFAPDGVVEGSWMNEGTEDVLAPQGMTPTTVGLFGPYRLFLPQDDTFMSKTCWEVTERRRGVDPAVCRFLTGCETSSGGWDARCNMPEYDKYGVRELQQLLEARLPPREPDRPDDADRIPDWIQFSSDIQSPEWCSAQKDLVYQAFALLQLSEVQEMIEVAICMFVALFPKDAEVTEQARVLACLKSKIAPTVSTLAARTLLSTGAPASPHLSVGEPLELIKEADLLLESSTSIHHQAAGALAVLPGKIRLSNSKSSTLRKATKLYMHGFDGKVSNSRSKICATVALARLFFHEMLHLCCVIPVPEKLASNPSDPSCPSEHTVIGAETCDIINMTASAFGFFLDQLTKGSLGSPNWSESSECSGLPNSSSQIANDDPDKDGKLLATFPDAPPVVPPPCGSPMKMGDDLFDPPGRTAQPPQEFLTPSFDMSDKIPDMTPDPPPGPHG